MAKDKLLAREKAASPDAADLGRGRRNANRNTAKRELDVAVARSACCRPADEDSVDRGVGDAKRVHIGKTSPPPPPPAEHAVVRGPDRRLSSRAIIRKVLPGEEPSKVMPSSSRSSTPIVTAKEPLAAAGDTANDHQEALLKVPQQQQLNRCPHCDKVFMSRYGLIAHLDSHPKHAVRCRSCEIVFPSHRGLVTHRRMKHSDHQFASESNSTAAGPNASDGWAGTSGIPLSSSPAPPSSRPIMAGFFDLTFADFSCRSFPLIAQHWCERQPRPSASMFHDFTCTECKAAFPIASALQLHMSKAHEKKEGHVCSTCGREFSSRDSLQFHQLPAGANQSEFLQHLQLFPACIRSRDVCVDDTHLNTAYYALLAKHRDEQAVCRAGTITLGREAGRSAQAAVDGASAAASPASSSTSSSRSILTLGNNVGGSGVKNGQLRRSRQS